jgi:hypothetical protein
VCSINKHPNCYQQLSKLSNTFSRRMVSHKTPYELLVSSANTWMGMKSEWEDPRHCMLPSAKRRFVRPRLPNNMPLKDIKEECKRIGSRGFSINKNGAIYIIEPPEPNKMRGTYTHLSNSTNWRDHPQRTKVSSWVSYIIDY